MVCHWPAGFRFSSLWQADKGSDWEHRYRKLAEYLPPLGSYCPVTIPCQIMRYPMQCPSRRYFLSVRISLFYNYRNQKLPAIYAVSSARKGKEQRHRILYHPYTGLIPDL